MACLFLFLETRGLGCLGFALHVSLYQKNNPKERLMSLSGVSGGPGSEEGGDEDSV